MPRSNLPVGVGERLKREDAWDGMGSSTGGDRERARSGEPSDNVLDACDPNRYMAEPSTSSTGSEAADEAGDACCWCWCVTGGGDADDAKAGCGENAVVRSSSWMDDSGRASAVLSEEEACPCRGTAGSATSVTADGAGAGGGRVRDDGCFVEARR